MSHYITECDGRTYGLNCSQTCGACINNSQCHHVSGMCPWGCKNGFQGIICNEEYFKLGGSCDKNEKCIIDLGISIAISIFIVILGTSLNIAFWRRNSNRLNSKQSQETMVNGDSGNPGISYESTYTELGAVTSKQNTYDDIHHYS
nr:multiple epidermal growth factor-like domains protein 11 [Crassostrea gigas]